MEPIPRKLCKVRKRHECRVCGKSIQKGEMVERWSGVEQGEGWRTCHAHPECLDETVRQKWDAGDWECASWEREDERPLEPRKCFMCQDASDAWITLLKRPHYVCSSACYRDYVALPDINENNTTPTPRPAQVRPD